MFTFVITSTPDSVASHSLFAGIIQLITAAMWPIVVLVLIFHQRKNVNELLTALCLLAKGANKIKIFQVEVERDVKSVVENAALQTKLIASDTVGETQLKVPEAEVEASQKVQRLISSIPENSGKQDVVDKCFQDILLLAREYETTRANMKPSRMRTNAMNLIFSQMRTLGPSASQYLPRLAYDAKSSGARLAAIAILQMSPDLSYLQWLGDRISSDAPFVFFQACVALLSAVRFFGASKRFELEEVLRESLNRLNSFKDGEPDRNSIYAIEQALLLLGSGSLQN